MTEHSRTLAELTEELEKVKLEMEERGNSMTDGGKSLSCIVNITYCIQVTLVL